MSTSVSKGCIHGLVVGCAIAITATACGPTIDGSSDEAFTASLTKISEGLTQPQGAAVSTAVSTMQLNCAAAGGDTLDADTACRTTVRQQLDGQSLSSLREKANAALESYAAVAATRLAVIESLTANPRLEYDPAYPRFVTAYSAMTNRGPSTLIGVTWAPTITRPDGSRYQTECAPTLPSAGIAAGAIADRVFCSIEIGSAFPGQTTPPPGATVSIAYKSVVFRNASGGLATWRMDNLSSIEVRRTHLRDLP